MHCESFQDRLQDFLDGKLGEHDRQSADAHLETCRHCSELVDLMRLEPVGLSLEPSPDLVGAVLERTSGSACDRARELICDRADGALEALDDELLRGHLDDCHECEALSLALARLPGDLAAMSMLVPDDRFVDDVLDATSYRPGRWEELASRVARGWAALVERPRFAWEAAYVGAVALWILGGAFGAPLRAASDRLSPEAPVEVVRTVGRKVTSFGHHAWSSTGARGIKTLDDLRVQGTEMGTAALDLSVKESSEALQKIKGDARTLWERFAADEDDDDDEENRAD